MAFLSLKQKSISTYIFLERESSAFTKMSGPFNHFSRLQKFDAYKKAISNFYSEKVENESTAEELLDGENNKRRNSHFSDNSLPNSRANKSSKSIKGDEKTVLSVASTQSASGRALDSKVTQTHSCTCSRTKCLKRYCVCYAAKKYCQQSCKCVECMNNESNAALVRNMELKSSAPNQDTAESEPGCNCKNSRCLKSYCRCFQLKLPCSDICKCVNCGNTNTAESKSA